MSHSSFGRAIGGFKPIEHDVREYPAELESLSRYLIESIDEGIHPLFPLRGMAGTSREAAVRTWLHRVVSAETRHLMGRDQPAPVDLFFDSLASGRRPRPVADPEEVETDLSIRMNLLDQLSTLPGNYLAALLLKEGKGLRVQGVARVLGTTPASVRSVLYRARQAIRGHPGT